MRFSGRFFSERLSFQNFTDRRISRCSRCPLENFFSFKTFDAPGKMDEEFIGEHLCRFGAALGTILPEGGQFLIATDCDENSRGTVYALLRGIQSTGLRVINLGIVPEPIFFYAARRIVSEGGVFLSASDDPDSGLSLICSIADSVSAEKPCESSEQVLNDLFSNTRWIKENMELSRTKKSRENGESYFFDSILHDEGANHTHQRLGPIVERLVRSREIPFSFRIAQQEQKVRNFDMSDDYIGWLQGIWFDTPRVSQHIILDTNRGIWSTHARKCLQAVFPQTIFSAIGDTSDSEPEQKHTGKTPEVFFAPPLAFEVDRFRAKMGILISKDGSQFTLFDEDGFALTPEELSWLIVQSFGTALENECFVHDLCCSRLLISEAARFGATPTVVPRGTESFRKKMSNFSSPLGIESQGNYFFRAIGGNCDILFTICWVIDYLARRGSTLQQFRAGIPEFFITPELIVPWEDRETKIGDFLGDLSKRMENPTLQNNELFSCDSNGWCFFTETTQNHAPALMVRAESSSWEQLLDSLKHTCKVLDSFDDLGTQLWSSLDF